MLLVGIGDSLTYGFPFTQQSSWLHIMGERLGIKTINKGICGETTGEMLFRFDRDVIALKPDAVIIMGGSNDAFQGIILQEVSQNIRMMAEKALQNDIKPIIGLPSPCNFPEEEALLEEYRAWMRDFAGKNRIPIFDFYAPLRSENGIKPGYHMDGIHPNKNGYLLMAEAALTAFEAMQEIQDCQQRRLMNKVDGQ